MVTVILTLLYFFAIIGCMRSKNLAPVTDSIRTAATLAAVITAGAVFGITGTAEAKQIKPKKRTIAQVETIVTSRLASNQPNPTAAGTLYFNPPHSNSTGNLHARTGYTDKITNPYFESLNSATSPRQFKLNGKNTKDNMDFSFGFDVIEKTPTTLFMKYDHTTMKFVPSQHNGNSPLIRNVKFEYFPVGGGLDYASPLDPNGQPYQGELFAVSSLVGQEPVALNPTD